MSTQTVVENPFATAKRHEKAFKIAQFLYRLGLSADDALKATEKEWITVAGAVKVSWDPRRQHPETIALVIKKLRALEAARPLDRPLTEEELFAPFRDE